LPPEKRFLPKPVRKQSLSERFIKKNQQGAMWGGKREGAHPFTMGKGGFNSSPEEPRKGEGGSGRKKKRGEYKKRGNPRGSALYNEKLTRSKRRGEQGFAGPFEGGGEQRK